LFVALPLFWIEGGCNWLATSVFPPRRSRFMRVNSVWIEAPTLPISWHHGWWLGAECRPPQTPTTVASLGRMVRGCSAANILPCDSHVRLEESKIRLLPPKDSFDMWLSGEGNEGGNWISSRWKSAPASFCSEQMHSGQNAIESVPAVVPKSIRAFVSFLQANFPRYLVKSPDYSSC
jgi:hypothetical protein